MKLDLQLTTQTKLLIGVLAAVLVIAVATQWGPGLYARISNRDMETKRQTLQTSKDLVSASKILKPIEASLYQKTGLAESGKNTTIFDESYPQTVIRERIDSIVKKAGIPQNYQLNMEPVPGKKLERISPRARRNLVVFLYQKNLEAEKETLKAEIEAEVQAEAEAEAELDIEAESMDMLMNAWLDEPEEDEEKPEKDEAESEKPADAEIEKGSELPKPEKSNKNQTDSENETTEWKFTSLPDAIPKSVRIELIDLVMPMTEQYLVGAENTLFENEFFTTQTKATSGFLGFGAKKAMDEISFHPNSQILAQFTALLDYYDQELNKNNLTIELLEYLEQVQTQITELSKQLKLAPASYSPESYTVKMKFKAEIEKLVNLNRIIETTTKWLMVRDLQISTDNKGNKINVDVLMIARVFND